MIPDQSFETARLRISGPFAIDPSEMLSLRIKNQEFWKHALPSFDNPAAMTIEELQQHLLRQTHEWNEGREYFFGVFELDSNRLVGMVALESVQQGGFKSANLAYAIDIDASGNRYGSEAVAAVVQYGFETLGLQRLQAGVQDFNEPSWRLLKGLGFQAEGVAREWMDVFGGRKDHRIYSLLRSEYEAGEADARAASNTPTS